MDIRGTNAALLFVAGLATLPTAAGCSSGDAGGGGGGSTTTTTTTITTTEDSPCATDPRGQHYAVGLSGTSVDGSLKMSFVSANPAPPAKGTNTWTLKVTDGSGAPVTGASFEVKPWMPDHLHGSSIVPAMTPMSEAGLYQVGILDFFMPGIWQTTITLEADSGPPEDVVFTFCISGSAARLDRAWGDATTSFYAGSGLSFPFDSPSVIADAPGRWSRRRTAARSS